MTTETHEQHINAVRSARRRHGRWLNRSWGDGFTMVHIRQLATLGVAVGILVAVTSTGAEAGVHGSGSGEPRVTAESRALAQRSIRALEESRFSLGKFDGHNRRHHGIQGAPTTTTLPPPTTTQPPPSNTQPPTTTPPASDTPYPVGTVDATEPSGMAPPSSDALAGYTQTYSQEFAGSSLPSGWEDFTGNPGSDPGAQWASSHVTVGGGMLNLNTWQDPAYGNEWVAGGLCQCGVKNLYGAYFIRSRLTGAGPTGVQLLWPAGNQWPPEIDFNETSGSVNATSATLHFGANNGQDQRKLSIDMTAWHTWGVIWTPTSVTYTVDGREWGSVHVASEISNVPMTLDLTQQTWCASSWACPSSPQSMQVDWVAEYNS